MTEEVLVRVEDLRGHYIGMFGVVHGVDGVTLSIRAGEAVGLVGESGCGKSTLAQLITGVTGPLLYHTGGRVTVDGYDVYAIPRETLRTEVLCRRLAYTPQAALNSLNPVKRVVQFLQDVVAERTGKRPPLPEIAAAAGAHFEKLGLDRSALHRYPHELSGGMRQRVVIAISTLWNPRILIVDEPASALDVGSQKLMIQMLVGLRNMHVIESMLFITHDIPVARQACDTLAVMYCGQLMEVGPVDEVLASPKHCYTERLLAAIVSYDPRPGVKRRLESIPGRPPDLRSPPPGCRFHPRCQRRGERCATDSPPETGDVTQRMVRCWKWGQG
jgi:peptide/nickel transport system ATP-binding protein